jgi:hypothetical protein
MQFVLNQFPRNSRHISRLSCEYVPIFLEEFDECEFLIGIQTIAQVSDLGRHLRGQRNGFAERVLRLDGRLGGLGLGHDWVQGRLGQSLLQVLELFGCCESVGRLTTLSVTVKGSFDVSSDGDDTTRSPFSIPGQTGYMSWISSTVFSRGSSPCPTM